MKDETFAGLVASFSDFLLVAIHTIIHERQIYPSNLFLAARKYNHPVRQARHPRVCRWIQDAVNACSEELLKVFSDSSPLRTVKLMLSSRLCPKSV